MRHVFAISGVGCMVPEQRACRYCTGALHDKSPAQFTCRAFLALFYHFEEMLIYRYHHHYYSDCIIINSSSSRRILQPYIDNFQSKHSSRGSSGKYILVTFVILLL